MINNIFITWLLAISIPVSYGQLDWKTTQITHRAGALDQEAIGVFEFTNIGDSSVTITEVKPSCGCTAAALEKKTFAPGESGKIEASFKFGSRQGLQSNTILITTDADEQPTILTLKTLIPTLLDIKPGFVYWKAGDAPDAKTVTLTFGIDEDVHITEVKSAHSNIETFLKETEKKGEYQLVILPLTTDEGLRTTILIKTDYPKDTPRSFYVHVHIKE